MKEKAALPNEVQAVAANSAPSCSTCVLLRAPIVKAGLGGSTVTQRA